MSRRAELVRAEALSNIGLSDDECILVVNENIANINAMLSSYPVSMGVNIVQYDLPTNFPFSSDLDDTKKSNRQFMIYGMIIERIENEGYKTRISFEDNSNTLYIIWESEYDSSKLTSYIDSIRKRVIKSSDVNTLKMKKSEKSKDKK